LDYQTASQNFRDAIRQDTTFAMAYVQLAYSLLAMGGRARTMEANSAMTTAFNLRNRLPERERYNVEGAYYMQASPDRRKAIPALRRAVELDSSNVDAANSLANVLSDVRDDSGSMQAYRVAIAGDPGNATLLTNIAQEYSIIGNHTAFDSVMAVLAKTGAPFPSSPMWYTEYWNRRDYDAVERLARARIDTATPRNGVGARSGLATILLTRGRLREAERSYAQYVELSARINGDTISPYLVAYFQAATDGLLRGDPAKGLATLDATMRAYPVASTPIAKDQSMWVALGYAALGAPAKARDVMNQHQARLDSLSRRQEWVAETRARGEIARAEGKIDSAIALYRRSDSEADGLPTSNCTICVPLWVGLAFDRGGKADSARVYLTQYVEMTGTGRNVADRVYLAPVLFRLGELYENANDAKRATEYYGRFVDLWAKADPELQPRVADARKRIEQLNRTKR
jgi:tetratricopeptide (TPR) repeat protein